MFIPKSTFLPSPVFYNILLILMIFGCFNHLAAQNPISPDAKPEKIADNHQFTEGPYWHANGFLLFSDIPANTIYKWAPGMKVSEEYVKPSGHSNGIASDINGKIYLAQHDGMISHLDSDKTLITLVKSYEGKRLNSPNDLAISREGSVYFTDPPYGVSEEDRELEFSGVYRLTHGGRLVLLYDELSSPNGIVFSPDQKTLYVNDTESGRILSFDVKEDGNVSETRDFASVGKADDTGAADGMEVDRDGNVYSTGPGGIYIFSPGGELIQMKELNERATNLGWGGENLNMLFITAPSGVYKLETNTFGKNK